MQFTTRKLQLCETLQSSGKLLLIIFLHSLHGAAVQKPCAIFSVSRNICHLLTASRLSQCSLYQRRLSQCALNQRKAMYCNVFVYEESKAYVRTLQFALKSKWPSFQIADIEFVIITKKKWCILIISQEIRWSKIIWGSCWDSEWIFKADFEADLLLIKYKSNIFSLRF